MRQKEGYEMNIKHILSNQRRRLPALVLAIFFLSANLIYSVSAESYSVPANFEEPTLLSENLSVSRTAPTTAYEIVYNGLYQGEASIDISSFNLTFDDTKELFWKILDENPELFYVNKFSSIGSTYVREIHPVYTMTVSEISETRLLYVSALQSIVKQVNSEWTDLQKVLYVHDIFALKYQYDTTYTRYSAYELFSERTGVCQAYTSAFTAVMKELGIPVSRVTSQSMNHTWNIVSVDGKWYHIDVTHDDPVADRLGRVNHGNFLRSDTGIAETNHYEWTDTANTVMSDIKYDSGYIGSVSSAFVPLNGKWYCIDPDSKSLAEYSFETEECTPLSTISDRWNVWGSSTSYWTGIYSAVATDGTYIYYNTPAKIYRYNTATGQAVVFSTPDCAEGYIYGITVEGDTLYYQLSQNPNMSGSKIFALDLEQADPPAPDPEKLIPSETAVRLEIGQSKKITINAEPADADMGKLIWVIGNPGVASVKDGVITAESEGETTLTVSAGEGTATVSIKITVSAAKAERLEIAGTDTVKMKTGETLLLEVRMYPDGAEAEELKWLSDNPSVVSVNEGNVKALSAGEAVIKVSAGNGNISDSVNITVEDEDNRKPPEIPFTDVPENQWYCEYVAYAYHNGLFNGTSSTTFSPDMAMTRAMFVQLFANLDGEDLSVYTSSPFEDTEISAWYGKAVAWASACNLVKGVDGKNFAPELPITREQMCLLIINYANYAGIGIHENNKDVNFSDSADISEWAESAVIQCARAGFISGKGDGSFDPQGTATRAEVATLLTNFCRLTGLR